MERELVAQGALQGGVHIDILRLSLPIIRADYMGLETYIFKNCCQKVSGKTMSKFSGSLAVWGGADDLDNVCEESLMGWREHLLDNNFFSFQLFQGSHFYFMENESKTDFIDKLTSICMSCAE